MSRLDKVLPYSFKLYLALINFAILLDYCLANNNQFRLGKSYCPTPRNLFRRI